MSQNFKYCLYCKIYDDCFFNSSSFEQIPIGLKNESSLNNMLQHLTDTKFFNRIQDQAVPCLQCPNKTHSNNLV